VKGCLDTVLPVITQIVNLNVPGVIGALGSGTKGFDRPLDVGVTQKTALLETRADYRLAKQPLACWCHIINNLITSTIRSLREISNLGLPY